MNIRTVRRLSQVFFAGLFLWFCVVSTLGTRWWQLRGWPVNWLLELDPLVALGTLLTTRTIYAGLLWALATVALTIVLGRFFCGWVCPFGSLHQAVGYLGRRRRKYAERVAANQYRPAQAIKYYLLAFLLTAAAGGLIADLLRLPRQHHALLLLLLAIALVAFAWLALSRTGILSVRSSAKDGRDVQRTRARLVWLGALMLIWAALGLLTPLGSSLANSLQTGLLDPIPLIHRSVNLTLLPLVQPAAARYYDGAWLIGAIFLAATALNLIVPRFYCRFLCPLGALFGVLGRFALWRIGKVSGECTGCELCEDNCEGACEPFEKVRLSECLLCMNCRDACRQAQIAYRTQPSAAGEIVSPEISRRAFLIAAASGVAAVPLARLGGLAGPNWQPTVIRPPGALAEEAFLERCIKCGQCMRICPTNIIQPAGLQAGLEGLWTPVLNYRIGTSGCQLRCVACSQVCPTAALRPLSLEEKLGLNEFAAAGPVRLGTAFVDRGRCLPWAMDKPCIVCQENCPVSPKAIFLREEFAVIRDGLVPVAQAGPDTIEFDHDAVPPDRLATGDYFCAPASNTGGPRRRIIANTARRLTLAAGDAANPGPTLSPGSVVAIQVRLQRPQVDAALCIGCGVCEHECPVSGHRAIQVTAENESRNRRHALIL